jgi:hypothetical protein
MTSTQSTYLLPNSGGFGSFLKEISPDELNDKESSPEKCSVEKDTLSENGGSSLSEYFSPMSACALPEVLATQSSSHLQNPEDEEIPISEEERAATASVQSLLDRMNSASSRMIECEQEIRKLEDERQLNASTWGDKKRSLIKEIGSHAIDRARPIFDAYEQQLQLQQSVNEAALLYNQAVIECDDMKSALQVATDNGSTDQQLADLLAMLVSAQTKRDTYEHLSLERTTDFKKAQTRVSELRKSVGLRTVEKAWPWFEAFMQSKGLGEELTNKIHVMKKEMSLLREDYRDCMQELEAISVKVHAIRKRHEDSVG